MTKQEAITEAIKQVDATGQTQFIYRRGDKYDTSSASIQGTIGWKVAEMVSRGNVHAYRPKVTA